MGTMKCRRNVAARHILNIAVLVALATDSLSAQRSIPFADFRTFRCEFQDGEGRSVRDGKTMDTRGDHLTEPVTIDNVNYKAQSARLVGNAGGADLAILKDGPFAITFSYSTSQGGVGIITIFKRTAGLDLKYRAVMSRHLAFTMPEGSLSMAQYYGTCRALP